MEDGHTMNGVPVRDVPTADLKDALADGIYITDDGQDSSWNRYMARKRMKIELLIRSWS